VTAPTTPNAELAYKVLDHIDAHPKQWDQSFWLDRTDCGTVGCFAGWATALSGLEAKFNEWGYGRYVEVDGQPTMFREAAKELLGIGEEEGNALFSADNTREALGELVAEIFGPRPAAES